MSRIAYWTILVGTEPTAFRARNVEDLVPTLKQLQRGHPNAVLKWFEAGRIWDSPDHARAHRDRGRRELRRTRERDWRPGGEHRDPRARPKVPRTIKRRLLARRYGWKKTGDSGEGGDAPLDHARAKPRLNRPSGGKGRRGSR
ncbi:MAG: hypothetical protein GEU99_05590 [Luteitalea sp.]|nr:hypothetical protein [Luteitalea sp.]